ncbi:MAG: flavin reductase family protein [Burkholderiales bacterium]|nr:flavin reductase family protein [Burkholderiales bacterium]
MQFDMQALAPANRYKILTATITPRPIAWVSTLSRDGVVNVAPYSFFNAMGSEPPIVVIGLLRHEQDRFKDTGRNILDGGEFVVNLVSEAVAQQMNLTCIDAPPEVSEAELAGLRMLPSERVKPPRVDDSPVSFECRNLNSIVTGPSQMIVVGEVLMAHVRDEFVLDAQRCHIDTPAMGLIGRMHGAGWYARTRDLFQMQRPRWATWKKTSVR